MERLSILYASALYDLAQEYNAVGRFRDQASMIVDLLDNRDCLRILEHPQITAAEKCEFFSKVFAGHIHDGLLGFLFLTVEKNREPFMIPALKALIGMIERSEGKVTADVMTAVAYSDTQISALKDILSKKLGKTVEIAMKTDPSVIGGPYIFVDGFYLDWTVKKRLRDLTVYMKEGCSA